MCVRSATRILERPEPSDAQAEAQGVMEAVEEENAGGEKNYHTQ